MGRLQHITCSGRSRYDLDNSPTVWCCKTCMWLGRVGIRSGGFGADFFFFFPLTRLSRVLEGEVSRRIGVCLRSQPSKVNGRKPKQMVINGDRIG